MKVFLVSIVFLAAKSPFVHRQRLIILIQSFFKALLCILSIKGGQSAAIPTVAEYDFSEEFFYIPEEIEALVVPMKLPIRNGTMPNQIEEPRQFGVYRPIYFRPWKWPMRHNPILNPLYGLRNPYYENKGTFYGLTSSSPFPSYASYASIYGATSIYDIGGFYG